MADSLSAEAIYDVCLKAGFSADQAVTMTAVAMAESSGNPNAVAVAKNEHSVGLFQINLQAHAQYTAEQLTDPLTNARAAFEVSQGGRDISPWTVTHRGDDGARYNTYHDQAVAAATAAGHAEAHGYFDGVAGYGDHHPAGDLAPLSSDAGHHDTAAHAFVQAALNQQGDAYQLGATPSAHDVDPKTFDCSSLVQWAAKQAGVTLERTAEHQYLQLKDMGTTMSVEQALHTPGALLFHFPNEPHPGEAMGGNAHVAISLGDGRTIEAIGTKWGVREVDVATFHTGGTGFFTNAGYVPGLAQPTGTVVDAAGHHDAAAGSAGAGANDPLHPAAGAGASDPLHPGADSAAAAPPHLTPEDFQPVGFWHGDGTTHVDPSHPFTLAAIDPSQNSAHGLPELPPIGALPHGEAAVGEAAHASSGFGRSLPGLGAAGAAGASVLGAASEAHAIPGLPATATHAEALAPLPALPGLDRHPDAAHPDAAQPATAHPDLQHLIGSHHTDGDHGPMADWASGHASAGEVVLHPIESGHAYADEISLHPIESGAHAEHETMLHPLEHDTSLNDHHAIDAHDLPHDFHG